MLQIKLFATMLQYRDTSLQTAIYTPMRALLHVYFWWIQNATDPGRQNLFNGLVVYPSPLSSFRIRQSMTSLPYRRRIRNSNYLLSNSLPLLTRYRIHKPVSRFTKSFINNLNRFRLIALARKLFKRCDRHTKRCFRSASSGMPDA